MSDLTCSNFDLGVRGYYFKCYYVLNWHGFETPHLLLLRACTVMFIITICVRLSIPTNLPTTLPLLNQLQATLYVVIKPIYLSKTHSELTIRR